MKKLFSAEKRLLFGMGGSAEAGAAYEAQKTQTQSKEAADPREQPALEEGAAQLKRDILGQFDQKDAPAAEPIVEKTEQTAFQSGEATVSPERAYETRMRVAAREAKRAFAEASAGTYDYNLQDRQYTVRVTEDPSGQKVFVVRDKS